MGTMAVLLCLGVGWMGALDLRRSWDLDRRGRPADAVVVAAERVGGGCMNNFCSAPEKDVTVMFIDSSAVPQRASARGPDSTQVGDHLRVTYDPQHPEHVRWEGSTDFSRAVIFLPIGVVWLVVLLVQVFTRHPRRSNGQSRAQPQPGDGETRPRRRDARHRAGGRARGG